jgi:uncharacterized membrane protein
MEIAILALVFGVFFLIVVPWAALSGRRDAQATRFSVDTLRSHVLQLQQQLDDTRAELATVASRLAQGQGAAPSLDAEPVDVEPLPAKPFATAPAPRSKRSRAAAKAAGMEQVAEAAPTSERAPPPEPVAAVAETGQEAGQETPQDASPETPTVSPWPARPEPPAPTTEAPVLPTPGPQTQPKKDLEEVLGTRWAVWVGGLALAIGALFLVRYTIEAGVFGPRVRLAMAALLSAALFASGEALRRGALMPRRIRESIKELPVEHAPLALTAAGVVAGFGTIYAAYALYGFLGQAAAFVLMGGMGIAAIGLSLLHGQAIAGIGMLASYATPILVGGESGSRWTIVTYLLVVTGAALAMQNRLRSNWLAIGAFVGMAVWTLLIVALAGRAGAPELTMITASLAMFAAALAWLRAPDEQPRPVGEPLVWLCLAGPLAAIGLVFLQPSAGIGTTVVFALIAVALTLVTALRDGRAALAIAAAALLPLGMLLTWPSFGGDRSWLVRVLDGAMLAFVKLPVEPGALAALAAISGLLLLAAPLLLLFRRWPTASAPDAAGLHAIAFVGGVSPVVIAFAWALRGGVRTQDLAVAALFAGLMLVLGYLSDRLYSRRSDDRDGREAIGAGAYASGAALAMGLAIAFALPGLWMAVGFAAAALAVALLNDRRPLPALRRVAAIMATTAVLRGVTSPTVFGAEAWPILNWYIAAYGLPALALGGAAYVLARQARDRNVRVLEGSAVLALAAFAWLELRHAAHRGTLHSPSLADMLLRPPGFHETWMFAAIGLSFVALGLRMRRRDDDAPARGTWMGGLAAMLASVSLGYGVLHNPIAPFRFFVEGYPLFNRLTLGHGLAAILLAAAAWLLRREGLARAALAPAAVALGTAVFWLFAQVRMAFHGGDLVDGGAVGLGETGVYTLLVGSAAVAAHAFRARLAPGFAPALAGALNVTALGIVALLGLLVANPWLDGDLSGPPLLDSSFTGYLLTGLLFGYLAWRLRTEPFGGTNRFVAIDRAAAIGLAYVYVVTQVRRAFAGVEGFVSTPIRDPEQYAYSAATLAFGVALLAVGFRLASRDVRMASAVFVILAVAKVFLHDMAGLAGLWRAFSFIGLGAVLIGIGLVYQRLLFDRKAQA